MKKHKIDHRHYICILFILGLVAWSVFVCRNSYIRLFFSVIDFGIGLVYAIFYKFDWCPVPDVNELKYIDVISLFPKTWSAIGDEFSAFIKCFFSKDNFLNWYIDIYPWLDFFSRLLMFGVMVFAVVLIISAFKKPKQNNDYGKETKACRRYKAFEYKVIEPVGRYLRSLYRFFINKKYYWIPSLIIFLTSTNIVTIVVAFLSYYFYFLGSKDFLSIAYQLYKLSVDVIIMLGTLPFFVWMLIGFTIFDKVTIYFAYGRLDRQEHKNMSFLDNLGIVVFITGVMRAGKTTLVTLLMMLQAKKYRKMSKGIMLKMHTHFPYFPWSVFQQDLLSGLKAKKIKSLSSVELYIDYKHKKFKEQPCTSNLYGYEYERYGMYYDDGLVVSDLFVDLEKYAQAFLVYTEPTYYISTYSVREGHILESVGNMPRWDTEIFRRKSFDGRGEYSHILDHDMLRPGRKMDPESKNFGAIEYGIIGIPEIDKERANTLETQEIKAKDDECNQKNDLFNQYLKMMGHAAMIDFLCFIRLFCDSQRVSSWGADGRELSDVLFIGAESEDRLTLRFWNWRGILNDLFKRLHDDHTFEHWYNRGDTSLPIYLLWRLTCRYLNYCERVWNTFGYTVSQVLRQDGAAEEEKTEYKIYKQRKAVYAGVFSTASYKSYFRENNKRSGVIFNDIERFSTLDPSLKELAEKSNSHMMKKFTEQTLSASAPVNKKKKSRRERREGRR